ncbi:MAG: hypothetical protein VX768_16215 [Planctomycetota bacterium]|nr:hypothetical protein [Planctomycetota bacterium]
MSFKVRMSVLALVLIFALCGLGWEYGVVLPSYNNAQTALEKLSFENIRKKAEESATLADVKNIFPKTPSGTKFDAPPKMEADSKKMRAQMIFRQDKYLFSHVLPWKKPETITVVYQRRLGSEDELDMDFATFKDEEWVFKSAHFNSEVPATAQRSVSRDAKNPGDFPMAAGGGGAPRGPGGPGGGGPGGPGGKGGGPGGKGGGPGGGRQMPEPEELMKERDKNKDGKLSGDEIPEMMSRFIDRVDEDKDGSISLDELKAVRERMQNRQKGGKKSGPGDSAAPATKKEASPGKESGKEQAEPKDEAGSKPDAPNKLDAPADKPEPAKDEKAEQPKAEASTEKTDEKPAASAAEKGKPAEAK